MKKLSQATLNRFNNYIKNIHYNYFDSYMILSLTVTNKTRRAIEVPLFGSVNDNKIFHKHVEVDNEVEYSSVLKTLLSRNLYISKMRITSLNASALHNSISVVDKNIYGQSFTNPMNISSWLSPYQTTLTIAENADRSLIIGNDTTLTVNIPAEASVKYDFYESKFFEFKYNLNQLLGNSSFGKSIDKLITNADYIVRMFNQNPHLHDNKGMGLYCNEIKYKIYNCIHDKTFELTLHKNLIDLYDKLSPFVQKYMPIINSTNAILMKPEPHIVIGTDKIEKPEQPKKDVKPVKKPTNKSTKLPIKVRPKNEKNKKTSKSNKKIVKKSNVRKSKKVDNSKSLELHKKALKKRGLLKPEVKLNKVKKTIKKTSKKIKK